MIRDFSPLIKRVLAGVTEKRTYVNKGFNLESPYVLTVFSTVPSLSPHFVKKSLISGVTVTMRKHPTSFKLNGDIAEINAKVKNEAVVLYEG